MKTPVRHSRKFAESVRRSFATPLLLLIAFASTAFAGVEATNIQSRPANWAAPIVRLGLVNFHQLTTNFYRGAQPSAKGMAELKAMGIKTVVNLRRFHSDADELEGIELKGARLHMNPWHAEEEDVIEFLKIAADTNNLPIFVHCQRGADRTGLMCAMYRITLCNWTKEEAIRELKEGGFGFNPAWQNIIRYIRNADVEKIRRKAGIVPPSDTHSGK